MRAIADGEAEALDVLFQRYSGVVYALCLRIVHDRADADELLVDVFWELWERAAKYDAARSKPLTFLMTLTRSRAIDRWRARPRGELVAPPHAAEAVVAAAQQDKMLLAERRAAVARSLAGLDDNQRKAIELSFWDDMTHVEIASELNAPLGTVKTWIRNGLSRLKFSLKGQA